MTRLIQALMLFPLALLGCATSDDSNDGQVVLLIDMGPQLAFEPSSLRMEPTESESQLQVVALAGVSWTLEATRGWLTVGPEAGVGSATITVTLDREAMALEPGAPPPGGTCSPDPTCGREPYHVATIRLTDEHGLSATASISTFEAPEPPCDCRVVRERCSRNDRGDLVCRCSPACCCEDGR